MTQSLEATEAAAAAVATHPRVTLEALKAKIHGVFFTTGDAVAVDQPIREELSLLTICMVVMQNGFVVLGKSAPASPENFNAQLGRDLAYEDAVRQIWSLEGYLLREALFSEKGG